MDEEEAFKGELARIRERMRVKKEDSSLTEIFKKKKGVYERDQGIKKIAAAVRALEDDKRITGAARASLDWISAEQLDRIEKNYPKTAAHLYKIASDILEGKHGPDFKLAGQSGADWLTSWGTVSQLLEKEGDDILQQPILPRETRLGFSHLLSKYLSNLINPSHLSIDMMLKNEEPIEKPIEAASHLKNVIERTKSYVHIVGNLFASNRVDKALEMVSAIKVKQEVAKPLTFLVKQLLSPKRRDMDNLVVGNQIDEAIKMAESLPSGEEKDRVLQRIATGLAKHGQVDKALLAAQGVSSEEGKGLAWSSMVSALCFQEDFEGACRILDTIHDPGFREDSIGYIVRGLLEKRSYKEAIQFVNTLSDKREKLHAGRLILSTVSLSRDPSQIEEVKEYLHHL